MKSPDAERLMRLPRLFDQNSARVRNLEGLSLSILYALAAKNTPPELVGEVIRRTEAGETITRKHLVVPVTIEERTGTVPYSVPKQLPGPMPLVRHSTPQVRYVDPPDPQPPASAKPEPQPKPQTLSEDAIAFFEALAAILPLPDVDELAKAYRAQSRVTVANVRELVDALQELVAYLLDDATSDSEPPRVH
jgi:hypothetical protein